MLLTFYDQTPIRINNADDKYVDGGGGESDRLVGLPPAEEKSGDEDSP